MEESIEDIADSNNLWHAVRFVRQDKKDELVIDPLKDVTYLERNVLAARLDDLAARLKSGTYEPRRSMIVEVGKGNFTTRPMSHICLEDWIVAQAILNVIAPKLDEKIPKESSYAMRLNPDRMKKASSKFYKAWYRDWPRFRRRIRAAISDEYPCIVVTDIAGYFEHVDLNLLSDMILELGISREIVNLIFAQLQQWTWRHQYFASRSRGLLQGNDISSMYANFYLKEVDKRFGDLGVQYHRYMDDIVIHARDQREGRLALGELARFVRQLGLSLNSGKTRVLSSCEEIENFFNFSLEDELEAHLRQLKRTGETRETRKQRRLLSTRIKRSRNTYLQKRIITAYARARDRSFAGTAFRLLATAPEFSDNLCRYFRSLDDEGCVLSLVSFLEDKSQNIFPAQEQQVLECLLSMTVSDPLVRERLADLGWKKLGDSSAHPYSRSLAILLVYRCGGMNDVGRLVDRYLEKAEPHPLPKRHLALAATRLVDDPRTERVIDKLKSEVDPDLTELGLLMEQLQKPATKKVKSMLEASSLHIDYYEKPAKCEVYRLGIRDLVIVNLCRMSPERERVRAKVEQWLPKVGCSTSRRLLEETRLRI